MTNAAKRHAAVALHTRKRAISMMEISGVSLPSERWFPYLQERPHPVAAAEHVGRERQLQKEIQRLRKHNHELQTQQRSLVDENARLKRLATHDGLTGLTNRQEFQTRLEEEFSRAVRYHRPFSCIMLDVDWFKHYNDTYGHLAGDKALSTLAMLLNLSIRAGDIAARYGGEEFVLLLPNADPAAARACAERIRAAIAAFSWPHRPVTTSLGICTWTATSQGTAELVDQADRALYYSKRYGRDHATHFSDVEWENGCDDTPCCQTNMGHSAELNLPADRYHAITGQGENI